MEPATVAAMRQVLAELSVCSNAPTSSINQGGALGAFASRDPTTGDNRPPHLYYRDRFLACRSEHARELVLDEARRELVSLRRRTVPVPAKLETRDALLLRIVREAEGWSVADTASALKCSPGDVKEARKRHGRAVSDGSRLGVQTGPEDRPERVRRLRAAGVGTRDIAAQVGVSQSTVMNWIRKAA